MSVATLWSKDNVTIYANGKSYIVGRQFAEYQDITDALRAEDFDRAVELADRATAIRKRSDGAFDVVNGIVYRAGVPVHNVITARILEFVEQGLPFGALLKFLENVSLNPSARAVEEGYKFLEHRNMPITSDGCFLAYKSVRADYKDKYSGTIDNSVGQIVEVERNLVDDNFKNECSYGLHVGCLAYSGPNGWYHSSGDKVVIVKVNPKDIVSVPDDHNATKMRVCRYEVIADFAGAYEQPLVNSQGGDFTPDSEDEPDTCWTCGTELEYYEETLCDSCREAEEADECTCDEYSNDDYCGCEACGCVEDYF